jgi:hypothetical protein
VGGQKRERTLNRIVARDEDEPGLTIVFHLAYQISRHFEVSPISNIYLGKPGPFEPHVNDPQLLLSPLMFPVACHLFCRRSEVFLLSLWPNICSCRRRQFFAAFPSGSSFSPGRLT